ncbi:hypothetical protein JNUCC23_17960 [Peribacillus sp. JNUCC 23]
MYVLIQGQLNLRLWPMKAVLLASLSMACYQPLFFSAVFTTISTVIAIGSTPIFSGVLEWFIVKNRPVKR